ncbi:MAG: phage tail protein, partial [Bryobacteraceae bacterium]
MPSDASNVRYWNREGLWLDFEWSGLELSETGSLRLHVLPRLDPPRVLPPLAAAAGALAIGPDGSVVAADPATGRIERIEPCH